MLVIMKDSRLYVGAHLLASLAYICVLLAWQVLFLHVRDTCVRIYEAVFLNSLGRYDNVFGEIKPTITLGFTAQTCQVSNADLGSSAYQRQLTSFSYVLGLRKCQPVHIIQRF